MAEVAEVDTVWPHEGGLTELLDQEGIDSLNDEEVATDGKACDHCKGSGQCYCEECMVLTGEVLSVDFREEFDTGRQGEGTCYYCNGTGRAPDEDDETENPEGFVDF